MTAPMSDLVIGADPADPRLPQVVIDATMFGATEAGLVPASGGAAVNVLHADGTWAPPGGAATVPATRLVATTAPLTGGGDLSADRTLAVSTFTTLARGVVPASGPDPAAVLHADGSWAPPAGGIPPARRVDTAAPLTGGGDLSADRTLAVSAFTATTPGVVPAAGTDPTAVLHSDGTWQPPIAGTTPTWSDGFPTYDPRYVNLTGDVMTGTLGFNDAGGGGFIEVPNVSGELRLGIAGSTKVRVSNTGVSSTVPISLTADPAGPFEVVIKQYCDTHLTAAAADLRYVNLPGDRMTGRLDIIDPTEPLRLARGDGSNFPVIGFYDSTFTTRYAYIGPESTQGRLNIGLDPTLRLSVIDKAIGAGASELFSVDPANRRVTVPLTGVLRVTVPADFWSSGSCVFIDAVGYVGSNGSSRVGMYSNGYRNNGTTWTNLGTAGNTGACAVECDPLGEIVFSAQGTVPVGSGPLEGARFIPIAGTTGTLVFGRRVSSTTVPGAELNAFNIRIVTSHATVGPFDTRQLVGSVATIMNMAYNGTTIGSIARNGTNNGVVFNQTSHGPWKSEGDPITDDEALATIRAYRPVRYQWRQDPSGRLTEVGAPSGPFHRGLIAQEVVDVQPDAVAVGGDNEFTEGFQPWGVDYGRLTPDLIAAIQACDRRLTALEAA